MPYATRSGTVLERKMAHQKRDSGVDRLARLVPTLAFGLEKSAPTTRLELARNSAVRLVLHNVLGPDP